MDSKNGPCFGWKSQVLILGVYPFVMLAGCASYQTIYSARSVECSLIMVGLDWEIVSGGTEVVFTWFVYFSLLFEFLDFVFSLRWFYASFLGVFDDYVDGCAFIVFFF